MIGDRAIMSDANLTRLESANCNYIVAFPLRKLSQAQQTVILDRSRYSKITTDDEISHYFILELGICFYSIKKLIAINRVTEK